MNAQIAIVGAGPVAVSLALALAANGERAQLFAPGAQTSKGAGLGSPARVYALSPATMAWLKHTKIYQGLNLALVAPVMRMLVSNPKGHYLDFSNAQTTSADDPIAWIVDHDNLAQAAQAALKFSNVSHVEKIVSSVRLESDYASLACENEAHDGFSLVIGADGARSTVREQVGIDIAVKDYGQTALVAALSLPPMHLELDTAFQWFTSRGVIALLPLPRQSDGTQRFSLVWSCLNAQSQTLLDAPETLVASLADAVSSVDPAVGNRLKQLTLQGPLTGVALQLQTASALVLPRACLVGDAAHVIHPLAGQGMNLGFGDVQALYEVLSRREPLRDPGDVVLLRRYARQRAPALAAMRATTDGLASIFAANRPGQDLLAWGWQTLDTLPRVKRQLISHAMR
jgi:2-polyprenylphenol 6-hydroxylase